MEGHELGTHIDKVCADSSTGTTPQSIQPFFPNLPIIWDIFKKTSPHHMSIVHGKRNPHTKTKTLKCDVDSQQISFIFGLKPDLLEL